MAKDKSKKNDTVTSKGLLSDFKKLSADIQAIKNVKDEHVEKFKKRFNSLNNAHVALSGVNKIEIDVLPVKLTIQTNLAKLAEQARINFITKRFGALLNECHAAKNQEEVDTFRGNFAKFVNSLDKELRKEYATSIEPISAALTKKQGDIDGFSASPDAAEGTAAEHTAAEHTAAEDTAAEADAAKGEAETPRPKNDRRQTQLKDFYSALNKLIEKRNQLPEKSGKEIILTGLISNLSQYGESYVSDDITLQTFKIQVTSAISTFEPMLRGHRHEIYLIRVILDIVQKLATILNPSSLFAAPDSMKKASSVGKAVGLMKDLEETDQSESAGPKPSV